MPSNQDLVEAARNWKGVRWVHQGRNRAGVDCVGLLMMALKDIGIEVRDMKGYRRSPNPEAFLGNIFDQTIPVEGDPFPGAIGVFRDGTQPCHVAIFAETHGRPSIIHAYAGIGKVIEEVFDHEWPARLVALRAMGELD